MGRKHGKNNCAGAVFTYAERSKVEWGTQSRRIGSDFALEYNACAICLHRATDPMCCHKGHMFCKQCIFEHLLSQKTRIKEQMRTWKAEQQELESKAAASSQEQVQEKMKEFMRSQTSVLASDIAKTTSLSSADDIPDGYKVVTTPYGQVYVRDHSKPKTMSDIKDWPCYWVATVCVMTMSVR
jgi:nitric oxide synthase-interacting protein